MCRSSTWQERRQMTRYCARMTIARGIRSRFRFHRRALRSFHTKEICDTAMRNGEEILFNEFTRAMSSRTHLSEFNCRPRNDRDVVCDLDFLDSSNWCEQMFQPLFVERVWTMEEEKVIEPIYGRDFPFKFYGILIFFSCSRAAWSRSNHLNIGQYSWEEKNHLMLLLCSSSTRSKIDIFCDLSNEEITQEEWANNIQREKENMKWLWLDVDGNHEEFF